MNTTLSVSGIVCFGLAYLTGLWPKFCLDRFQQIAKQTGQNLNDKKISFREMKKMNRPLFKQYLLGFLVSTMLSVLAMLLLISASLLE
jgi:hypothetical protein